MHIYKLVRNIVHSGVFKHCNPSLKQRFVSSKGNIEKVVWVFKPGRPFWAVLKKTLGANYKQLIRRFFHISGSKKTFWFYFENILASALKSCIAYRWEKIEKKLGSIFFWVKIGYSHTIECVWERRTSTTHKSRPEFKA